MTQITGYIAQINTQNYNDQCKSIKKKLLFVTSSDIGRIIYFKKLHVILYNLLCYLAAIDIEINEKKPLYILFKWGAGFKIESTYTLWIKIISICALK